MNIPQSIRTAGSALKQYFTDPVSLKQIGKAIGTDAALGAAAQQIVPRMIGQRPAQSIPQSLIHAGVHSAVNVPVSGALQSIGTPAFAAATTGGILGSAAAAQFANQINPEIVQENHANFHQLYAMQVVSCDSSKLSSAGRTSGVWLASRAEMVSANSWPEIRPSTSIALQGKEKP